MKLQTAINQIKQEANFLGLTVAEVMADVQKYGRMVYRERTVEAYHVVLSNTRPMIEEFSPYETVNS
jgi:hypothetical protein